MRRSCAIGGGSASLGGGAGEAVPWRPPPSREFLVLKARRRLKPLEAIDTLVPIMGALAAAHDVDVIHRDLKADNIFLARASSVEIAPKLIDFGIARCSRRSR